LEIDVDISGDRGASLPPPPVMKRHPTRRAHWPPCRHDAVAITVAVAASCYLAAAALGQPWIAWTGLLAGQP
jgi:hypothetical protein